VLERTCFKYNGLQHCGHTTRKRSSLEKAHYQENGRYIIDRQHTDTLDGVSIEQRN